MTLISITAFNEILRNLHYPNPPPFDAFRKPNPILTIEIITFLLQLYKPSVKLPDKYETTEDRIAFFRFIGEFVYKELRIELQLKWLYESKEPAVKEILKIANEVFRAQKLSSVQESQVPLTPIDSNILDNIKSIKRISSQITELGIKLYDLIADENELKKERNVIFNQHHNVDYIRRDVEQANKKNAQTVEEMLASIQILNEQQSELFNIKKRRENEFERTRKRLEHLSQYKPAHLEDLEQRENDMQLLFNEYSQGCRNVEYLQYELQLYQIAEEEEIHRNQIKIEAMRKKLYKHEQNQMFEINNASDVSQSESESDSDREIALRPKYQGRAPTSPSDSPDKIESGNKLQKAAFSDIQSSRPTSRRRPQSSNLYGTEKRTITRASISESESDEEVSENSEYSNEDEEDRTANESEEDSQISGEDSQISGEDSNLSGSEASGSDYVSGSGSEYSDEEI